MKYFTLFILLFFCGLVHVEAEQASSFISFGAIMGGSAGYYRETNEDFASLLGTLGVGCHLLFWNAVEFDYNFAMHTSFLMDLDNPLHKIKPFYSHDIWTGYRFRLGDNYLLSPQISLYHRYVPSVNAEFIGGRIGIDNIILIDGASSEYTIMPFVGYALDELSYGFLGAITGTEKGFAGTMIISYEYSHNYQMFMMYYSMGFTIFRD